MIAQMSVRIILALNPVLYYGYQIYFLQHFIIILTYIKIFNDKTCLPLPPIVIDPVCRNICDSCEN